MGARGERNRPSSLLGAEGAGNGVIPDLAGQQKDYLVVQLGAYASGARDNAALHLIAKGMTPKERISVAAYLSSSSARFGSALASAALV